MKKIVCFILLMAMGNCLSAKEIKVLVTSESMQKTEPVRRAFAGKFREDSIGLIAVKTKPEVPEQPIGYATGLKGARNRIKNIPLDKIEGTDYLVSVENYIEYTEQHGWIDAGVVILIDRSLPVEQEKIYLTKETAFPEEYFLLAKSLSPENEISIEGLPVTIGKAIAATYPDRDIDPQNWHKEKEFGGISRLDLIEDALFKTLHEEEINYIRSKLEFYKDFPKKGIEFVDFFPIVRDAKALQLTLELFEKRFSPHDFDIIVGLESRGFILGAALAGKLNKGFVPVRKPGKLPGAIYEVTYEKEYGLDTLAISRTALKPNQKVLIIDDVIATGGSAKAAVELVRMAGGIPIGFASLLKVKELDHVSHLSVPKFNLID